MVDLVYVLRSQSTGRRNVGQTENFKARLREHNSFGPNTRKFTSKNPRAWIVIQSEEHDARRNLMDLNSGVGMLQDRPRFLRWLSIAAPKSIVRDYEIDRLIPRRDTFDLRIRVQDQKGEWRPMAFQIVAAPAVGTSPFQLGQWDLVYRDPLDDVQVHIAEALDDDMRVHIGGLLGAAVVESSLFAYAPDRRGVVRYCTNEGGRYFGKLYRSGRSENAFETSKRLRESGLSDCLAEPVARVPKIEMIIWREANGSLLAHEYATARYDHGLRLAGSALRRLHDMSVPCCADVGPSGRRTLDDEFRIARTYLDRVSSLAEKKSSELEKCCDELGRHVIATEEFEKKTLHGDFHDNQVLVTDSIAVLLDLDQHVSGDSTIDVGNFLAHIDFRIAYEQADDDPIPHAAAFLDGYGQKGEESFQQRVLFAQAVSLLRNCCLYVLVPTRLRELAGCCRRTLDLLSERRTP